MGLAVTMNYCDGEKMGPTDESTPHFDNITYARITGDTFTAGVFTCLPESPCKDFSMEDVQLQSRIAGNNSTSLYVSPQ